ncbi:MAG: hypothetical protein V3W04_02285 [Gammaproteobacteria bacterium]
MNTFTGYREKQSGLCRFFIVGVHDIGVCSEQGIFTFIEPGRPVAVVDSWTGVEEAMKYSGKIAEFQPYIGLRAPL